MTDEPELPLAGLDAERPLPPELAARLEAALLAAVAGALPVPADAESLDAPRPLPEPLRVRLEAALLAEAAATPTATTPTAGQAPAAVPAAAASASPAGSAAVVPLERRRRKVVAAWSAVAAVLLMVVAVAGLAGRGGDPGSGNVEVAGGPTTTTAETPAPLPSGAGASPEATAPAPTAPAGTATTRATRPPRPSPSTTAARPGPTNSTVPPASPTTQPVGPSQPVGGGESQPAPAGSTDPGPAPPFYESAPPGGDPAAISTQPSPASPSPGTGAGGSQDAAPPSQTQKSGAPAASGPPLRVGIVAGDDRQMAGFGAYISRLNQSGGVRGHSIELVTVSPNSPRTDTIATVNLSSRPVAGPGGAPGWATGPLLETLTATENLLPGTGAVFSFASPPERQGHLAADALFPSQATGKTAVIYAAPAGSGPLADVVPAAMRKVLEERGVAVEIVQYDPNERPARLLPADAALLSLDPAAARAWVTEAKSAGWPAPALAGIYSLADDTLLPDLPEGATVVSPYVAPAGEEGQAIRSGAGGTSASVLHGWATAKSLAAAIWRTGADTPAELQAALEGLTGWSSGLAPPYETRPDTRARTPEGVVFRVQSQAFVADGGFRRDPF